MAWGTSCPGYLQSTSSQLKETSQQPFIPDKNLTSALGTFQFWLTDMPQTFQELELAWPIVQTTELEMAWHGFSFAW